MRFADNKDTFFFHMRVFRRTVLFFFLSLKVEITQTLLRYNKRFESAKSPNRFLLRDSRARKKRAQKRAEKKSLLFSPSLFTFLFSFFFFTTRRSVQLARRLIRSANGSHAPFLSTPRRKCHRDALTRPLSSKAYDATAPRDKKPTVDCLKDTRHDDSNQTTVGGFPLLSKKPYACRLRHTRRIDVTYI